MGEFIKDRLPDPVPYYESEGLVLKGRGKWRPTECRFHGSRDSMRINTETGGFVCMAACGAKGVSAGQEPRSDGGEAAFSGLVTRWSLAC